MQRYEKLRDELVRKFEEKKVREPESFEQRLNLSWSNWGFGIEDLSVSVKRLANNNIPYIELHGNHYGPNLGYKVDQTKALLDEYGLKVSGVCGMFSDDNDLASNRPIQQEEAIAYIRREVEFTAAMGGDYLLVVPAAVGRPIAYDEFEFFRSTTALRSVADIFTEYGVKAAIEPVRGDETTLVHTIAEAKRYIDEVDHPGVQHINGDVFHMQLGENNIAEAILSAGSSLVNLHLADSNRKALGSGSMDIDAIIMALYLINYNTPGHYVTPEPLGGGASPYASRNGYVSPKDLDALVGDSADYFREREAALTALD